MGSDATGTSRNKDALLRVDEVAELLRVSPSWVRGSVIPVVMLGRSRRYRAEDVRRHIEANVTRRKPREEL